MNKYKRTNFMNTQEVDGNIEMDMAQTYWDLFKIKRPISFDTIYRSDLQRPDLFSYRVYSRIDWWWIISKVNHIDDWWNDVEIGQDIIVPNERDIEDYYLAMKNRRGNE